VISGIQNGSTYFASESGIFSKGGWGIKGYSIQIIILRPVK
jgi:hypothetical protein